MTAAGDPAADHLAPRPEGAPLRAIDVTVLGGPTTVIDLGGLRLVVDPTFDPPGEYPLGGRSLVKMAGPAWAPEQLGRVDAVFLSHDQHPDNLDRSGRALLARVPRVLTTTMAASRLGGRSEGMTPWESTELRLRDGTLLRVTATPAQHGPAGTEHLTGPVTGFVLSGPELPTVYVSGDNASLEVVRAVNEHFPAVDIAVLFAGGAKTALLGDEYLTLSSAMAAEAVAILGRPRTVIVHVDGWAHFSEPRATIGPAFERAGVADTLVQVTPGAAVTL
jgi:L-ascorbate metabolism protein UlaG (beta-lactamase superfamily)